MAGTGRQTENGWRPASSDFLLTQHTSLFKSSMVSRRKLQFSLLQNPVGVEISCRSPHLLYWTSQRRVRGVTCVASPTTSEVSHPSNVMCPPRQRVTFPAGRSSRGPSSDLGPCIHVSDRELSQVSRRVSSHESGRMYGVVAKETLPHAVTIEPTQL